jgi:hypothetical protein
MKRSGAMRATSAHYTRDGQVDLNIARQAIDAGRG